VRECRKVVCLKRRVITLRPRSCMKVLLLSVPRTSKAFIDWFVPPRHRHRLFSQIVLVVGCWFVGGDDLTGALDGLQLQLSPPLPSSFASINTG